jgi:hypothetical protein
MRQETNNEMDLLLRRLSGREAGGARDGETGLGERHLDVDELSSYAQNVLPTAARARYTEHLAECASCRKLVGELALSLGTVTAAAPVKTGLATTGLKAFLASLFSPMVLRYAIPALGLILVAVVGFVALRKPSNERFVAKVGDEQKELRVREPVAPGLVAPTPPESLEGFHDNRPAKPQNEQERVDQRIEEKGDAGKGEGAAAGAVPAPVTKPADEVQSTSSEARPTTSAAEAPPAASKVGAATAAPSRDTETSKEKKAEAQAKKQPETTDIVVDGADANANKPAKNEVTERRVADLPVQNRSQGLQKLRAGTRAAEDKDTTEKESTETRSVAGRTFKKERGIWIDTAYDSSTRTRNLARGSESFRALVADEPAINTIAEQLDGEVIVVWKGRAYRIR